MPVTITQDGDAEVTCDCGKPLTVVNKYGMFCEDMCDFEESKQAADILDDILEMKQ